MDQVKSRKAWLTHGSPEKQRRGGRKTSVPGPKRHSTYQITEPTADHTAASASSLPGLGRKCSGEGQAHSPEPSSYPRCPRYEPPLPDQLPAPAPGPGPKPWRITDHGTALKHVSVRCRLENLQGLVLRGQDSPSASLSLLAPLSAQRPWSGPRLRKGPVDGNHVGTI